MAEAILTALRPWLREPMGWELDVHPGKPYSGYGEPYVSFSKAQVSIIKDRIRPTFECAECKYKQTKIHRLEGWIQTLEGYVDDMRKLANALPVTSAELEGE